LTLLLDGTPRSGRLTIEQLGTDLAAMRGELEAMGEMAATTFRVHLPAPAPAPVVSGGQPGVTEPPPASAPEPEDLVFAALGNTGTGDDNQYRIGRSLGKLAASGPLDLALLLGDLVLPAGVKSNDDQAWHRCFEAAYPDLELPVPFHAVLGDRDHLGNVSCYNEYGSTSARFRSPNFAYTFTVQSHGLEVLFVGIDTTLYGKGVGHPAMRFINRVATTRITESKAALKIVFGHQTMFGHGPSGRDTEAAKVLRTYMLPLFEKAGVDLYISAGDHHQELLRHGAMVEVVTGTGGGRARSVECGADTLFASTAPGFAWFRFDGEQIEVSFRGGDGGVLHVHWRPAKDSSRARGGRLNGYAAAAAARPPDDRNRPRRPPSGLGSPRQTEAMPRKQIRPLAGRHAIAPPPCLVARRFAGRAAGRSRADRGRPAGRSARRARPGARWPPASARNWSSAPATRSSIPRSARR
jgi:hypothetical protein